VVRSTPGPALNVRPPAPPRPLRSLSKGAHVLWERAATLVDTSRASGNKGQSHRVAGRAVKGVGECASGYEPALLTARGPEVPQLPWLTVGELPWARATRTYRQTRRPTRQAAMAAARTASTPLGVQGVSATQP